MAKWCILVASRQMPTKSKSIRTTFRNKVGPLKSAEPAIVCKGKTIIIVYNTFFLDSYQENHKIILAENYKLPSLYG